MSTKTMAERKILVVDDDRSTRELLRLSFKAAGGYTVFLAEDGRQGLDMAIQHSPDIVLSDVVMPKMDGYELCRELKQHPATHSIPVLLLTARGDSEATIEGFQAGADDYIPKPFDPKELMVRIERALRWLEQKTEHAPKISGSLQKTPLFELISFCEEHRISGIVHLAHWIEEGELSTKVQGKIHLHLGEIMAIQFKDFEDVTEALDELLEWEDGTFTIEQEELQLPALPGNEPEHVIDETPVSEDRPEAQLPEEPPQVAPEEQTSPLPKCPPQLRESVHRVLDELKIQSGNLDYADVTDSSGEVVHAVGPLARTKAPAIREAIGKLGQLSTQVAQDLDLGDLDETMILSETGLVLLYPIEQCGTMSVVAPKEDQGMMRWNCNDALDKIADMLSS